MIQTTVLAIFGLALSFLLFEFVRRRTLSHRKRIIDEFNFPAAINKKIKFTYPHLSNEDVEQVMRGLREYFHLSNIAGKQMVSMPSQVVDIAWHEFILYTQHYQKFCAKAFGRFLHHTPAEVMKSAMQAQEGIKLAWKLSCEREDISPNKPVKLPLLFALDSKLKIPDGFKFAIDCTSSKDEFCAAHITGCGGTTVINGNDSQGCSSGCGGGD